MGTQPARSSMWLVPFLLCCGLLIELTQSQRISIIGPNVIQPNRDFTVVIHNSHTKGVNLKLTFTGESPSVGKIARLNGIEHFVPRSGVKKITFQVGNITADNYKLAIQNVGGTIAFYKHVDLRYVSKTMSIFIQTDKLVYKPGDLIRFRIIVMNIETKPILQLKSLVVDLKDTSNTTVAQWERTSLYNGVFEENFVLGPASALGNWRFYVTAKDGLIEHKQIKPIEVKEYVLPKFLITVSPSNVLLVDDKQISLTIQSIYTFGDPVNGQARVDLYLTADHRRPDHISKFTLNGGSGRVLFNLANKTEIDDDMNHRNVMVNVSVTEGFSGRTVFKLFYIPVYKHQYDITMKPSSPEFIPGEKYSIDFTVKDHSGNVPDSHHKLKLTVTYGSSEEDTYVESMLNANGVAKIDLYPSVNASSIAIEANFDTIENYELGTILACINHLKVAMKNKPRIDKTAELVVESATKMESFTYVVMSKGNILVTEHVRVQKKTKGSFRFKVTPQMAPKSTVVVFSEATDSESKQRRTIYYCLELEVPLANDFKFFADREEYQPGEDIEITTDAAGDSYVAFNAIDRSSLLLGYDTLGFTKQDVMNELDGYIKDVAQISELNFHGMFLESSNEVDHSFSRLTRSSRLPIAANSPVLLRADFHEVFLWHNFSMHGWQSDHKTLRTVPDTITSWQVTAFALSPTVGLGMMDQPVQFVVKKPFYIVANLPYSIKRNEISLIQVTVFSFLGSELLTDVLLYCKNDEFEFIGQSYTNDTIRRRKVIMVPANYGKQTSFMIKAKKLGSIAIKIEAINDLASDGIEHTLLVTPESLAYQKTESRFIENTNRTTKSHNVPIDIPRAIDQGSVNITFAIDPVLLGLVKENLNSLLILPTGCGEQNMVKLVPNVVALDYLKESREINKELETKARDYLKSGYQNQLKYRLYNGSFSIFANNDSIGSTFLTAFVVQTFKIVDKYEPVDRSIVNSAFDWLASIQSTNGLFEEVGQVYNTAMQGGLNSRNLALSAFVAIAFLENEEIARKYSTVLKKTIDHLAGKITEMDTYEMALTTYALSLHDHPQKVNFLDRLTESSQLNEQKARYWNDESVGVEIASYALLSLVKQDKRVAGIAIMRWLVTQRESSGGFWGSQSTFVGLKALAVMASFVNPQKNDYTVRVHRKHVVQSEGRSIVTDQKKSFGITAHTLDVMKTELPTDGRAFQVDIEGRGFGIFQITYQYHYNILNAKKMQFNVQATIQNSTTDNKQVLRVCTNFNQKEKYTQSNMALVEVFFPSGFVADQDSVLDLWNDTGAGKIMLIERRFEDTSLVVYYNNIDVRAKCFEVTAYRRHQIAEQLPAYVVVYDFNDKERFGITRYEGKALQPCDICGFEDCEALGCQLG